MADEAGPQTLRALAEKLQVSAGRTEVQSLLNHADA